jgi:hypothetical protein
MEMFNDQNNLVYFLIFIAIIFVIYSMKQEKFGICWNYDDSCKADKGLGANSCRTNNGCKCCATGCKRGFNKGCA